MQSALGDILNWFVAGALFPLLLAPLAGLVAPADRRGAARSVVIWLFFTILILAGGFAFGALAPRLWSPAAGVAPHALRSAAIIAPTLLALGAVAWRAGGPGPLADALARPVESLIRAIGGAMAWFAYAMAFLQFAVVILRYVFGLNFIFMQEGVTYFHGAVFLLAGGYALLTNDHVRVDIYYSRASARTKALIDLAGTYLFLFPFCLVTLWAAGPYVANAWSVLEGSTEQSGIQGVYLLKSLIPAFAVLLALAGFVNAVKAARLARGGYDEDAGTGAGAKLEASA